VDPQALMQRMGGNWAAFAGLQAIAALRWKSSPRWLLIVAGVRLSDVFTDLTCVLLCDSRTWFAPPFPR
jgi:hypothetical protein